MWAAIGEVLLDLLMLLFGTGRSGAAAVDVVRDDDGRRLLVMNHGPGVARSVRIRVDSVGGRDPVVLSDGGEVPRIGAGKWRWLEIVGGSLPAGSAVSVSWDREDGGRFEQEFTLSG